MLRVSCCIHTYRGYDGSMNKLLRIRLSPAQVSALECREGGGLDEVTLRAWQGEYLVFPESERELLFEELIEASNCEDAQAEEQRYRGENSVAAYRAALSFSTLTGKVLRAKP